jgi:hypothetical protein
MDDGKCNFDVELSRIHIGLLVLEIMVVEVGWETHKRGGLQKSDNMTT